MHVLCICLCACVNIHVWLYMCLEESHSNSWHAQAPTQNVRNPLSSERVWMCLHVHVFICKTSKCMLTVSLFMMYNRLEIWILIFMGATWAAHWETLSCFSAQQLFHLYTENIALMSGEMNTICQMDKQITCSMSHPQLSPSPANFMPCLVISYITTKTCFFVILMC